MTSTLRELVAAALIAAAPTLLHGQGLADVAKKAAAERAAKKAADTTGLAEMPTKVYTNDDVADVPTSVPAAGAPIATDTSPAPAAPSVMAEYGLKDEYAELKTKPEAWWKDRMRTLYGRLTSDLDAATAASVETRRLTGVVNSLRGAAQAVIFVELRHVEAESTRLEAQIVVDRNLIDATEETARHAGVLPGWLRLP
jgi:hypothetical protein